MAKKTKEKTLKFGLSEYEGVLTDGQRTSVEAMRSFFLDKASKLRPEVVDELQNDLLDLYQQIPLFFYFADGKRRKNNDEASRMSWYQVNRPNWKYVETAWNKRTPDVPFTIDFPDYYAVVDKDGVCLLPAGKLPLHADPFIQTFVESLFAWSNKYHLDAEWCRAHAYETLDLWSNNSVARQTRVWSYGPWFWLRRLTPIALVSFDPDEFVFRYHTLYPSVGFRKETRDKILTECAKELDDFLLKREEAATKRGMASSLQKRDEIHFDWLVDFQVNEMSYVDLLKKKYPGEFKSIKDKDHLTERTKRIRKAVNQVAQMIGLPLRKEGTKPGPKPKK